MSPNVFKGLMECCRLIPAACLINKNLQFVCKCNLGLISSAHLHLEKNNKLKFNVAIMRVYGDCGEEGGRGEARLMRGLSEGSGPTRTSRYRSDLMHKCNPSSQSLPEHARLHNTGWQWGLRQFTDVLLKTIIACIIISHRIVDWNKF